MEIEIKTGIKKKFGIIYRERFIINVLVFFSFFFSGGNLNNIIFMFFSCWLHNYEFKENCVYFLIYLSILGCKSF